MTGKEYQEQILDELRQSNTIVRKYDYPGIYSISIGDQIVYIGKSVNMLKRLSYHIYGIKTDKKKNLYKVLREAQSAGQTIKFDVVEKFNEWFDSNSLDWTLGTKEGQAIREYRPVLNVQIPHADDYHHYDYNKEAKTITWGEICERWKNNV